ncbi:Ribonucleoprotein LSM domain eukaryotic/archaea-type [Perkinsela sp. CCAP 1560/4]|nr:Ribonucleoprotein LSM domain eukaryotic/archaea-type [Perkinsela sp. CCAP 1560/4]|eukprot:KNH06578.1 Ribonucleoprotein LSM domain eukaryotic/archaea-type [Perkinsela sp. CCAP 1560/4]
MDSGLDTFIGLTVGVHTTSDDYYQGKLNGLDSSGNLVISNASKNDKSVGTTLIRGDAVSLVGIIENE